MKVYAIRFNIPKIFSPTPKTFTQKYNADVVSFGNIDYREKIKAILEETLSKNEKISGRELGERLGITPTRAQRTIYADEELSVLWFKAKTKEYTTYTDEDRAQYKDSIKSILEDAKAHRAKVSINEISAKIGIPAETARYLIRGDEALNSLFEEVKKSQREIRTPEELEELDNRILSLMLEYKSQNRKISRRKLAEQLGIKEGTLNSRTKANPILGEYLNELKKEAPRRFEEGQDFRKSAFEYMEALLDKDEYVTIESIAQGIGVSLSTLSKMLRSDKELRELKNMVTTRTKMTPEELKILDNRLHAHLKKKWENSEKTTAKEVSEYFNITINVFNHRLQGNPSLKYWWNKVKTGDYTRFEDYEKEDQLREIAKILRSAAQIGEKLTYVQIGQNWICHMIR